MVHDLEVGDHLTYYNATVCDVEIRTELHEPAADSAVVEAWADDYIRFEHLPVWQKKLRDEIRARCRQLEPSAGQVLHATYFGAKHLNADVENLVLSHRLV